MSCDWYSVGVTCCYFTFEKNSFWQSIFRPIKNEKVIENIKNGMNKFGKEVIEVIEDSNDVVEKEQSQIVFDNIYAKKGQK